MRRIITIIVVLWIFVGLTACGAREQNAVPELDYSIGLAGDDATEEPAAGDVSAQAKAVGTADRERFTWGHTFNTGRSKLPDDLEIVSLISDRLGVSLALQYTDPQNYKAAAPPDFFLIYATDAKQEDEMRTIPRAFIEQYAPRYAQLLNREPGGWEINRVPGKDEYLGLSVYDDGTDILPWYSVYRLDWLENVGIEPNGSLTEIADGIYFTDQAFTQEQFSTIMRTFTESDPDGNGKPDTFGLALPDEDSQLAAFVRPLAGMWGINFSHLYYASDAYRAFLQFLSVMLQDGSVEVYSTGATYSDVVAYGRCGWWSEYIGNIYYPDHFNGRGRLFQREPNVKLLITPPEIGSSEQQGVSVENSSPFYTQYRWVAGAQVSDTRLAKLLTVFDALSFDPELWVTARYGFEGKDFNWEGEPYQSRIIPAIPEGGFSQQYYVDGLQRGMFLLHTYIYDGVAGNHLYEYGVNALIDFAGSDAGRKLMIPPLKEDRAGMYTEQLAALDQRYGDMLARARNDLYNSVVKGKVDPDNLWDAYLSNLESKGLPEYRALYDLYE